MGTSETPRATPFLTPEMILSPGGTFLMGKDASRKDESPAHRVTVGSFRAAVSPVTNAEYALYVAATGAAPAPFLDDERFASPSQPAVGPSWFDAVAYANWLADLTGIPFRLPTEAEREFAALGGRSGGDWPWAGTEHPIAPEIAAMDRPHPPSAACANGYGLRCMAENVHEWCNDWYAADYYASSPVESPAGPGPTRRKASRGGSWRHREKVTRINARSSLDPSFHYADFGFRLYADGE
ncbi:MAG: SUMF1/EgtB/PvdO family nonheme iron enzyme [Tepidiformaceae bacterium]